MEYKVRYKSHNKIVVKKIIDRFYLIPTDYEKTVTTPKELDRKVYRKITIVSFYFLFWSYKIVIRKVN